MKRSKEFIKGEIEGLTDAKWELNYVLSEIDPNGRLEKQTKCLMEAFSKKQKELEKELESVPLEPQEKITEVIKETIEEIEYWHSDMLSEEERAHPRCNGWARVYDKLKDLL